MTRTRMVGAACAALLVSLSAVAPAWSASLTLTDQQKAPLGEYLTDGHGRAMYMFTADKPGSSACNDACARAWPPVIAEGAVRLDGDVNAGDLNTIKRGKQRQVTYNGMPLYYFAHDKGNGSTAGEGFRHFGGAWYVVSPDGQALLPDGKPAKRG